MKADHVAPSGILSPVQGSGHTCTPTWVKERLSLLFPVLLSWVSPPAARDGTSDWHKALCVERVVGYCKLTNNVKMALEQEIQGLGLARIIESLQQLRSKNVSKLPPPPKYPP